MGKRLRCTADMSKVKLRGGEKALCFEIPHQSKIDHALKELADTTSQSDGPIILGESTRYASRHWGGKSPVNQTRLKRVSKKVRETVGRWRSI